MSTELVKVQQGAQLSAYGGWTQEELSIVKDMIMPGASDSELKLFGMVCGRTGLDPFKKQIYSIGRRKKMPNGEFKVVYTTQTSIEGFRSIAEKSGEYAGQTPPLFCGTDGIWSEAWLKKEPPTACRIGVHRKGFKEPLVRICKWDEYVETYYDRQSGTTTISGEWKSRPCTMLQKVTEAACLRAAFSNEEGDLLLAEEHLRSDAEHDYEVEDKPIPNNGVNSLLDRLPPDDDALDTTSTLLSVMENAQTTEQVETPEPAPVERIASIKNKLTELKWTKQVVIDTLGVYKVPGLWTHDDCDKLKHWCDAHEVLSSADSATVSLESPVSPSGESAPVSETVLTQEQADLLAEYVGTAEGTLSKLNSMCGRQFADCSTIEQAFAKICELHIDKVKNAIKIAMAAAKAKKDAAE